MFRSIFRRLTSGRHSAVAPVLLTFLAVSCISCQRETFLESEQRSVDGFQIEGTVEDRFTSPVPGVEVYVYLKTLLISTGSPPDRSFDITTAGQFVSVDVYNSENRHVKTITSGFFGMGSIQVLWDRTDGSGRPAATGLYTVRYSAGGQVRKSYPVLVNGGLTAVTDSTGHYVISNANLPIGAAPVPDYASDNVTFYGNYRIDTEVFLEFSTPRHYRLISVSLVKDQLALVNILLD